MSTAMEILKASFLEPRISYPYMVLFILSLFFLMFFGKKEQKALVTIQFVTMVLVMNPFTIYLFLKIAPESVTHYYHVLIGLLVLPVIACAMVRLYQMFRKTYQVIIITVLFLLVIFGSRLLLIITN